MELLSSSAAGEAEAGTGGLPCPRWVLAGALELPAQLLLQAPKHKELGREKGGNGWDWQAEGLALLGDWHCWGIGTECVQTALGVCVFTQSQLWVCVFTQSQLWVCICTNTALCVCYLHKSAG